MGVAVFWREARSARKRGRERERVSEALRPVRIKRPVCCSHFVAQSRAMACLLSPLHAFGCAWCYAPEASLHCTVRQQKRRPKAPQVVCYVASWRYSWISAAMNSAVTSTIVCQFDAIQHITATRPNPVAIALASLRLWRLRASRYNSKRGVVMRTTP